MATTSRGPSVGTTPNEGRRALGAGTSWWPCCSAIWPGRARGGRSAGDGPRKEGPESAPGLGKLVHLGLKKAPPRSTLPYANTHRPWELFETVFYDVPGRCQELASTKRRRFRFNNPLRSLDSTTIDLCAEVFDWATFRRTKGAVKLHLQLDHRGCLPCWALVTEGSRHEVKAAQGVSFAAGTIVALDRGYNDYRLFGRWTEEGVFFVTRAKEGIQYEIVERRLVPENGDVIYDEVIRLTGKGAAERCPHLLRLIKAWDPEQGRFLTFLTNIMHLAAGHRRGDLSRTLADRALLHHSRRENHTEAPKLHLPHHLLSQRTLGLTSLLSKRDRASPWDTPIGGSIEGIAGKGARIRGCARRSTP